MLGWVGVESEVKGQSKIGCLPVHGDIASDHDGPHGPAGCVRLVGGCHVLLPSLGVAAEQERENKEPTSGLEPLTPAPATSDNMRVTWGSLVVQNACKQALIYVQLPSATSSLALPVVSEWYQKVRSYRAFLAL
jgi:hypothetical protein